VKSFSEVNVSKFKSLLLKYSKSKSGQAYYLEGIEDLVKAFPSYLDILAKVQASLHVICYRYVLF
jgi:hypothetical protein